MQLYITPYGILTKEATKFTIDPNIQKMNIQLDESILNKKVERKLKKPEEGEICESCSS